MHLTLLGAINNRSSTTRRHYHPSFPSAIWFRGVRIFKRVRGALSVNKRWHINIYLLQFFYTTRNRNQCSIRCLWQGASCKELLATLVFGPCLQCLRRADNVKWLVSGLRMCFAEHRKNVYISLLMTELLATTLISITSSGLDRISSALTTKRDNLMDDNNR